MINCHYQVFDATYPSRNCISTTCYPVQDLLSTCIEGLLIYTMANGFKVLLSLCIYSYRVLAWVPF